MPSKFKIVFCNEPIWLAHNPKKKVLKLWKLLCNSIYSKYKNIKVPILGHLHRFPRGQCLGKTNEMKWGTTIGKKNWEHIGNFGGGDPLGTWWEHIEKNKNSKIPPKKIPFLFMLLVCGILRAVKKICFFNCKIRFFFSFFFILTLLLSNLITFFISYLFKII